MVSSIDLISWPVGMPLIGVTLGEASASPLRVSGARQTLDLRLTAKPGQAPRRLVQSGAEL